MTGPQDDDILAAEYALGLLEGAERVEAEARLGADPAFAALVDEWTDRLTPMLGGAATPPSDLWGSIAARLFANDNAADEDAPAVGRWRALGIGASALAAALALFIVVQPARVAPVPAPVEQAERPMMVAALKSDDTPDALMIGVEQDGGRLLITPVVMAPDSRVPELWVIPEDGKARSLGVIDGGGPTRVAVADNMRAHLHMGATLAISMEPPGGSPTGTATGPIVALGKIVAV